MKFILTLVVSIQDVSTKNAKQFLENARSLNEIAQHIQYYRNPKAELITKCEYHNHNLENGKCIHPTHPKNEYCLC